MEMHQLKYFVAAAELGNFTRAAEKCLVAQPSLSQQIGKLETELGRPLFERLGRTTRLTDAGRALYEQAVGILAAAEDARKRVAESGADGTGVVRVGAIPTVAPYLLPAIVKRFRQRFPRAEVKVVENLTEYTIKGCVDADLDVGLLALPVIEPRLTVEPLFSEELLLALAAKHPLTRQRRINLQDIAQEDFILLSETHCLGEQILSFCQEQSCLPPISCRGAQLLTVQEFVALGHGVSLIPKMAADLDRSKERRYRSLAGTKPTRTLAMIWHRQRFQTRLVLEFMRAIREHKPHRSNP